MYTFTSSQLDSFTLVASPSVGSNGRPMAMGDGLDPFISNPMDLIQIHVVIDIIFSED